MGKISYIWNVWQNSVFWVQLTRSYRTERFHSRFKKSMFFCARRHCFKNKFRWGLGSENRPKDVCCIFLRHYHWFSPAPSSRRFSEPSPHLNYFKIKFSDAEKHALSESWVKIFRSVTPGELHSKNRILPYILYITYFAHIFWTKLYSKIWRPDSWSATEITPYMLLSAKFKTKRTCEAHSRNYFVYCE